MSHAGKAIDDATCAPMLARLCAYALACMTALALLGTGALLWMWWGVT